MTDLATALRKVGDSGRLRTGRIAAWSGASQTASVTLQGETLTDVPALRSVGSVVVGDIAVLAPARGGLVILGLLGPAAAPIEPDPGLASGTGVTDDPDREATTKTRRLSLSPYVTGSARGGSWRGDTSNLYQGDWTGRGLNYGAAFYRLKKINGTTVTRVTLRIRRGAGGSFAPQAATLRLLNQSGPTGSPTSTDSHGTPSLKIGQTATVVLPDSWGKRILEGDSGGIGIYVGSASPYVRLDGRGAYSASMALSITYDK